MNIEKEVDIGNEREISKPDIFIVVKPDGGRYLREIEETLSENQIHIKSIYYIEDWEGASRSMYQKQLEAASSSFNIVFNNHIWLNQYLFGNQGLLLMLDSDIERFDLDKRTKAVHETRESFRRKFSASNDIFAVAVNLEKLKGSTFVDSQKKHGVLGVMQPDSLDPLMGNASEGTWYRAYFSYFHAPESKEELVFQYQKLINLRVITKENEVAKNEWELLKQIRCINPPSRFKTT